MISARLLHVVCIVVIALMIVMACASKRRYEVLSFFFDGVPSPEGTTQTETRRSFRISPFRASLESLAAARTPVPKPQAPPIVSIHKPVAEKKCLECHDTSAGLQPFARNEALCDKCHLEERIREGWDHGPINLGLCVPCHRAHESPYPYLLEQPVPQLCLICHVEDMDRKESYHEVSFVNDCTACHDPHIMY
jgi:predicted CXXCH cytochrome family protein